MRVLNIPTSDTGGNGIRTKWAFAKYRPDWAYDLVTSSKKYMDYPADRTWPEARALWHKADVVHMRNSFDARRRMRVEAKPAVVHHHGTKFRTHPQILLRDQRRNKAIGLAATLDLWLIAPNELEWLPSPYDIDWLQSMRPAERRPGPLRIAHAPTNRVVKDTPAFLAAIDRLKQDMPVEVILIERSTWKECLQRKAHADIYYDQVDLGYGNNAIEAWGMGIPVVCGAQPPTLEEMGRRFGSLPFYPATPDTIYDALYNLANPPVREAWSQRGLAHVRQWHSEQAVVSQLVDTYARAIEKFHS